LFVPASLNARMLSTTPMSNRNNLIPLSPPDTTRVTTFANAVRYLRSLPTELTFVRPWNHALGGDKGPNGHDHLLLLHHHSPRCHGRPP